MSTSLLHVGGDEDDGETAAALSLDGSYFFTSEESGDEYSVLLEEEDMTTGHPLEAPLPEELELRPGSQPLEYVLWSRVNLCRGKKFGPIPAQLKDSEPPAANVWKVVDEQGTVKAWVDTLAVRGGQWTTFLRKSDNVQSRNVSPVFYGGQIYLEVLKDIEPGQELHLASYNLLLAHESSSHHKNGNLSPHDLSGSSDLQEFRKHDGSDTSGVQPPPLVPIHNHEDLSRDPTSAPRCYACDIDFPDSYR
ncbi:histone-lysine N-methyltransferase MECOM-like [Uloborus diversus]|uniref:histone-lysine N-methyltransferase MECOM-like n=1 Tax=Uloborus diversus TaxID=327109 RepID=UPI00240A6582|nr:histone-lysine N-methyltransferase MECOM-like [Uloborus diversus]